MTKSGTVLKSGLWYTVSNFLSKGMLFLATPLFTRLMTQEEFGSFSNFSSWLNILMIVVTLNVEASLISARYDHADRLDRYVFSALVLSSISALIWGIALNVFMDEVSQFFDLEPIYINCMLVYLLFFPALQLFQTKERFFFRYKASSAVSLLSSVGSCVLSVILVLVMQDKLSGRIFGHVLPVIVLGLALYILIAKRGRSVDFHDFPYTLRVCLPYIPHLLSMTILNSTDRIMITKMCGDQQTALYSVAYSVAMIVTLFLTALNGAFSPWLVEQLSQERYSKIREVSKTYIAAFLLFAVGLMLLSPEILLIVGGSNYVSAKPVMLPVILGCACQFLYTLFVNVEQFYKKTVGMALASLSAAVLNYVLNWLLIPRFGYVAAAYTTLIGYLWLLLVHMLLVRRMKKSHVYSCTFILLAVVCMGVAAFLVSLLYTNDILRYVCVGVYVCVIAVVLWRRKTMILSILKK